MNQILMTDQPNDKNNKKASKNYNKISINNENNINSNNAYNTVNNSDYSNKNNNTSNYYNQYSAMPNNMSYKGGKVRGGSTVTKTHSITKIFAIAIIILGLCLSGSGSYAIISDIQKRGSIEKPKLTTEQIGNQVKLVVQNTVGIKLIKYTVNDANLEQTIQGKNEKYVEEKIPLQEGTNKLSFTVIDSEGNEIKYTPKSYVGTEADTIEPKIDIGSVDARLKITATDNKELDYIVYKYGNKSEQKVEATEDSPKKIEQYIDEILEMNTLLTVTAVDKAGNTAVEEQMVKGATKPKISVTPNENNPKILRVEILDNSGLKSVVIRLNNQEIYKSDTDVPLDTKEFEGNLEVYSETTQIEIYADNVDGQGETYNETYTYDASKVPNNNEQQAESENTQSENNNVSNNSTN